MIPIIIIEVKMKFKIITKLLPIKSTLRSMVFKETTWRRETKEMLFYLDSFLQPGCVDHKCLLDEFCFSFSHSFLIRTLLHFDSCLRVTSILSTSYKFDYIILLNYIFYLFSACFSAAAVGNWLCGLLRKVLSGFILCMAFRRFRR